jgi:hypothetical protein
VIPEALAQYGLPVARVPSFYRIARAVRMRHIATE